MNYIILIGLVILSVVYRSYFQIETIGSDFRYFLIIFLIPTILGILILGIIKKEFLKNTLKDSKGLLSKGFLTFLYIGHEEYGDGYRLDCKVVYQKAGIYFSLQAKVKNQIKVLGIWYARNDALWMWYNASWSKRCGNSGTANQAYCSSCYSYDNVLDARVYSSTRALEHYSYSVVFSNQFAGFWTRSYSISD